MQRECNSGIVLDIDDEFLSQLQVQTRNQNQISSSKYKACGGELAQPAYVSVGSMVYIKDDSSKLKARDRYIVVKVTDDECFLKKLVKSTIRNKEYKLKLTEVYPVTSNVLNNECYLRGCEDLDEFNDEDELNNNDSNPVENVNDNDYEAVDIVNDVSTSSPSGVHDIHNITPPINVDISPVTNQNTNTTNVSDVSYIENNDTESRDIHPRRSMRSRHKPKWMKDYDM